MKGGKRAWETDDQLGLPPDVRRKSWKPRPNFGPGFCIDPRATKSRRDACRAAVDLIRRSNVDRTKGRQLWRDLLQATRVYWADYAYDHQPTFGDIKKELRQFRKQLIGLRAAIDDLMPAARRELDTDRFAGNPRDPVAGHIGSIHFDLGRLIKCCDRSLLPKYVKVEAIAVPNCCRELEVFWNILSGQPLVRNEDNESTGNGIKFTADGPRYLQEVMQAIDPDVPFERLHTWLKKPKQPKNSKK